MGLIIKFCGKLQLGPAKEKHSPEIPLASGVIKTPLHDQDILSPSDLHTVDYHMNPQGALDTPQLEREVPAHMGQALAAMGHEVEILNINLSMGRGQIIWRAENGLLAGGTEPRCDGTVAAW